MVRKVLTDEMWEALRKILREHGCHSWKNDRQVMEGILWKLRTGAPWRDVPPELCKWKTAYNKFNSWSAKGLWDDFFLRYEEKLIGSGYSQTEVKYARTSMRAELGLERTEQSEDLEGDQLQRYTWWPMRMDLFCNHWGSSARKSNCRTANQSSSPS